MKTLLDFQRLDSLSVLDALIIDTCMNEICVYVRICIETVCAYVCTRKKCTFFVDWNSRLDALAGVVVGQHLVRVHKQRQRVPQRLRAPLPPQLVALLWGQCKAKFGNCVIPSWHKKTK